LEYWCVLVGSLCSCCMLIMPRLRRIQVFCVSFGQHSSSSSGPGAHAPDAPQSLGLLCDPCPPPPPHDFGCSHFRHQAPPRLYDVRDPSSERWNCGRQCWPVILPKCQLLHYI
jgi:hypothetical protein